MWTSQGWSIRTPANLGEDLAWSLAVLGADVGLARVSYRALARHTRTAPGTITNHYASKSDLWVVCTVVVGRWLSDATRDHVDQRGHVGLFPAPEDRTYRLLVSAWVQLRAQALVDPAIAERVDGVTVLLQRAAAWAIEDPDTFPVAWMCLEGLRERLVRPGSELTPEEALAVLARVTRVSPGSGP